MDISLDTTWRWRKQTRFIVSVGFAVILVSLVASYAFSLTRQTVEVRVGQSGVYSLWVAGNERALYKGLSGVDELPPNGGLLMDYKTESRPRIVMRDMKIPIDAVWLNKDKRVVHIVKNLDPSLGESKEFGAQEGARYILELPAGSVERSAIKIDDMAQFDVLEGR